MTLWSTLYGKLTNKLTTAAKKTATSRADRQICSTCNCGWRFCTMKNDRGYYSKMKFRTDNSILFAGGLAVDSTSFVQHVFNALVNKHILLLSPYITSLLITNNWKSKKVQLFYSAPESWPERAGLLSLPHLGIFAIHTRHFLFLFFN